MPFVKAICQGHKRLIPLFVSGLVAADQQHCIPLTETAGGMASAARMAVSTMSAHVSRTITREYLSLLRLFPPV